MRTENWPRDDGDEFLDAMKMKQTRDGNAVDSSAATVRSGAMRRQRRAESPADRHPCTAAGGAFSFCVNGRAGSCLYVTVNCEVFGYPDASSVMFHSSGSNPIKDALPTVATGTPSACVSRFSSTESSPVSIVRSANGMPRLTELARGVTSGHLPRWVNNTTGRCRSAENRWV